MAGIKLAAMNRQEHGPRYIYHHEGRTLYLDAELTMPEASHICDAVLEMVVSRSVSGSVLLRGSGPAA